MQKFSFSCVFFQKVKAVCEVEWAQIKWVALVLGWSVTSSCQRVLPNENQIIRKFSCFSCFNWELQSQAQFWEDLNFFCNDGFPLVFEHFKPINLMGMATKKQIKSWRSIPNLSISPLQISVTQQWSAVSLECLLGMRILLKYSNFCKNWEIGKGCTKYWWKVCEKSGKNSFHNFPSCAKDQYSSN